MPIGQVRHERESVRYARMLASVALVIWLSIAAVVTFMTCKVIPEPEMHAVSSDETVLHWLLAVFDITLAALGVLVRAFATSKRGTIPFLAGCSRKGGVRGMLSMLNLMQAIHLHVSARSRWSTTRALSAVLTTAPWWMDRRGGWTIILSGPSTFSGYVDADLKEPIIQVLLSHVIHLHGLFNGLNLTLALTHFREGISNHRLVELPHFRWYWLWLNITCERAPDRPPMLLSDPQRRRLPLRHGPRHPRRPGGPRCCCHADISPRTCRASQHISRRPTAAAGRSAPAGVASRPFSPRAVRCRVCSLLGPRPLARRERCGSHHLVPAGLLERKGLSPQCTDALCQPLAGRLVEPTPCLAAVWSHVPTMPRSGRLRTL